MEMLSDPKRVVAGVSAITTSAAFLKYQPNLPAFAYAFLTSNDRAIKYPREGIVGFAKSAFALIGISEVAVMLPTEFPQLFALLYLKYPWLEKVLTENTPSHKKIFFTVPIMLAVYNFFKFILVSWWNNLTPVTILPFDKAPFMTNQVALEGQVPDPTSPNFPEQVYNYRWVPQGLNITFAIARSASYYGMWLGSYLFNQFTIGIEYPMNVLFRIFLAYSHVGRFAPSNKTSRSDMYLALVNTSMICWMDFKTGNLRYENLRLPFKDTSVINVKYITIDLDHEKKEFIGMKLLMDDGLGEHNVADANSGADIEQAVVISNAVVSLYAHIHVHWWANGTAQLIKPTRKCDAWSLAKESNAVTQWMNNAASYGSYGGIGVGSAAVMADILSHNGSQGLPFHHCPVIGGQTPKCDDKFMHMAAKNSVAHQIVNDARTVLAQLRPNWTADVTNSFLASTIMHSADHYYVDIYTSFAFKSEIMRHDISFLRLAFFGPNTYFSRSVKCKENPQDDLCMAMYEVAKKHDTKFAEKLFIACAN